jgi:hypothetical protein
LLPEGARALDQFPEELFQSPEDFLGLVSALHETYHVFQSLVLGASSTVVTSQDKFVANFRKATRTRAEQDWIRVKVSQGTCASYQRMFYCPDDARVLYEHEARLNPTAAALLRSLPDLTTKDLLECQAALLTEVYFSRRRAAQPDAYDPDQDGLGPAYRLEELQDYNRPLLFFRERLGRVLNLETFSTASAGDRLYPFCPNIAQYKLLNFLLDFALHIPPLDMSGVDPSTLTVYMEDLNPVVRFVKLLVALSCDIAESVYNPNWRGPRFLNLDTLYSEAAQRLAHWIDIGNLLAISENRRTMRVQPSGQELFPLDRAEILEALRLSDAPVTFPLPSETSTMWLDVYEEIELLPDCFRLRAIRKAAMKARESRPDTFNFWRPMEFFPTVGLPVFFLGPQGAYQGATSSLIWKVEKDEFFVGDSELQRFSMVVSYEMDDGQVRVEGQVGLPYGVLDQIAMREVFGAICDSQVQQTRMACPLAVGRLQFRGCPARTELCSHIAVPDELLAQDCMARWLYTAYLSREGNPVITLTEELANRCLSVCESEVAAVLSAGTGSEPEGRLHFDASVLLHLLARQVLVPFVVSVTAGTTVAKLKAKWVKDQPVQKLKSEVTARLGQEIRIGDANVREECVLLVEDLLKPYGVTRDKARDIVDLLEATANSEQQRDTRERA